jgi:hypothetical protein
MFEKDVWGQVSDYWTISADDTGCLFSGRKAAYGPTYAVDDPKWDSEESQDLGRFILEETSEVPNA